MTKGIEKILSPPVYRDFFGVPGGRGLQPQVAFRTNPQSKNKTPLQGFIIGAPGGTRTPNQ